MTRTRAQTVPTRVRCTGVRCPGRGRAAGVVVVAGAAGAVVTVIGVLPGSGCWCRVGCGSELVGLEGEEHDEGLQPALVVPGGVLPQLVEDVPPGGARGGRDRAVERGVRVAVDEQAEDVQVGGLRGRLDGGRDRGGRSAHRGGVSRSGCWWVVRGGAGRSRHRPAPGPGGQGHGQRMRGWRQTYGRRLLAASAVRVGDSGSAPGMAWTVASRRLAIMRAAWCSQPSTPAPLLSAAVTAIGPLQGLGSEGCAAGHRSPLVSSCTWRAYPAASRTRCAAVRISAWSNARAESAGRPSAGAPSGTHSTSTASSPARAVVPAGTVTVYATVTYRPRGSRPRSEEHTSELQSRR